MQTSLSLVHVVREPAPDANPHGGRPPLLLLLHGVGANERQMAALAPAFDSRFVVVSVRSPIVMGPNAFAWFHVAFTPQGPVLVEEEARAGWKQLARFATEAVEAYGADPARVYAAGFSQGGIMSLAAILTAPGQFAGAACMSGRLPPEVLAHAAPPPALAGKPVLVVHGEHDAKLGVHLARGAREQLEKLPVDLTYHELAMAHEITQESLGLVRDWLSARLAGEVPA
jgi:phospholipase/carboxylesterase